MPDIDDTVVTAVDHQRRASRAGREGPADQVLLGQGRLVVNRGEVRRIGREEQGLGVGFECPPDAVLDLLGRVRLGDALIEEELREVARVRAPVVGVIRVESGARRRMDEGIE